MSTDATRRCALVLFCFYVLWNAWWLAHGRIPPSIFLAASGYPCPTTGGFRSLRALMHGQWLLSLRCNALTTVYLSLFTGSALILVRQAATRRRLRLPMCLPWLWLAALGLGWTLKLGGSRAYW